MNPNDINNTVQIIGNSNQLDAIFIVGITLIIISLAFVGILITK